MKTILLLAWKSLKNRKFTVSLTVITVAISILLLISVEQIRTQTKQSFASTYRTDLIVGGRSGSMNLLLVLSFTLEMQPIISTGKAIKILNKIVQ